MEKNNDDPIERLGDKLKREGLKPTANKPTISQLVAEGNAIIEKELKNKAVAEAMKQKAATKKKCATTAANKPAKVVNHSNPYIQARENILNGMTEFSKNEILSMENAKSTDNRWYDDFVQRVAREGDRLSS